MTPARKRALEIAADGLVRAKVALAAEAGCSTGVIDGLVEAGTLVEVAIPERRCPRPDPAHAQGRVRRRAGARPCTPCALPPTRGSFSVTLLDGVTGSGKTEVYFEAVARTLEKGRQALIMLPEIALTSQFMDRFTAASAARRSNGIPRSRRPSAPAPGAQPPTGEARVVVGARSALFLPFDDLGLIVVDEEHDAGFKQEDRVHYQARDMAVVRGSLGQASRSSWPRPRRRSRATSMPAPAATRYVHLPGRYSGAELPDVDDHRHAPASARAGQVAVAGAGRGRDRDARQEAAGAAVPQPPRLRAADAVPLLRPPHRLPAVHGLAGRAPLPRTGSTATIAASRCRSRRSAPSAASRTRWSPAGRAWSASPRRWPSAFPRRAWRCCPPTWCRR